MLVLNNRYVVIVNYRLGSNVIMETKLDVEQTVLEIVDINVQEHLD
jgi:hypothetical protein